MGKIKLKRPKHEPIFRKIALGTWSTVGDPSVYGLLEVDMTNSLQYLKQIELETGTKVTPTHLVGKAVALAMKARPEINGLLRFNRIYHRESIDVFYQVNVMGGGIDKISKANLSGSVIRNVDQLSLEEIAKILQHKSNEVRKGNDEEFSSTFSLFKILPWWSAKLALKIFSFLNYDLNLNLSSLGLPRDPFGSVMITSVGGLGIDIGFAPLVPYSRVPLLLAVGAIKDAPVAIDGKVEVRPVMKIGVTFDHRFMDGIHAAEIAKNLKSYLINPKDY